MSLKFSDDICTRSKNNRSCIFKHSSSNPIGEGVVKHIWSCKRCGKKMIESIQQDVVECSLSPTLNHQWKVDRQISFQQHYRYRQITEGQSCLSCGAERVYEYKSLIGYQPKR